MDSTFLDELTERVLVADGARYLFTNEYETSLQSQVTGWTADDVLDRVEQWVMTSGANGVRMVGRGLDPVHVPAAPVARETDPTGVGDAFRAGFLWGVQANLTAERAMQAGCVLAAVVLESVGTQEYSLDRAAFSDRVARAYGNDAAAEIESRLRV